MKIQSLRKEELSRVVPIAEAFSAEAGRPPFNFGAFAQLWNQILDHNLGEILFFEDGGEILGLLGYIKIAEPFTGIRTALEQFWFVKKEHRANGDGLLLLDAFEERTKDCDDLVLVHLTAVGSGLQKLYEARGYKLVEQTFKKSR